MNSVAGCWVLKERLTYARDLLGSQKIDPDDYREMKNDYMGKLEKLQAKLSEIGEEVSDLKSLIKDGVSNVFRLYNIYKVGDVAKKREVIGSIYPENFSFSNFSVRTARVNEVVELIYTVVGASSENKNGKESIKIDLSRMVAPPEQFSNHFLGDLIRLSAISD